MPIEIIAGESTSTLYVYGGIGVPDAHGYQVDPADFVAVVKAQKGAELTVRLATVGGDPVGAAEMFQALVDHPAKVRTIADSKAYSAGSLLLQAGDQREARPLAMVMVHGPRFAAGTAGGTAGQMREQADALDAHAEMMAQAYTRHGIPEDTVNGWLNSPADVYFSAGEALAANLIDAIAEDDAVAMPDGYRIAAMADETTTAAQAAQQEPTMADDNATGGTIQPENSPTNVVAAYNDAARTGRTEGGSTENQRIQSILDLKRKHIYSPAPIQAVLDSCISDMHCTTATAQERAIEALELLPENAPMSGATPSQPVVSAHGVSRHGIATIGAGGDQAEKTIEAMSQSVLARSGVEKQDRQNPYRGHTLLDLSRACLASAGYSVNVMSANDLAAKVLAAQTTSDFPVVLENTMHKMVLAGFNAQSNQWRGFCKVGSVSDLRDWKRITPGLISDLTTQDEDGDYRGKPLPDGQAESIAAELVGNIVRITNKVIINDDLNYIETTARGLGAAGGRTVNRKVFALLAANPTMADGEALFSIAHGNLAGSGAGTIAAVPAGPPDLDTVDLMTAAMAEQAAPAAKDDPDPSTQYLDLEAYAAVAHRSYLQTLRVINGSTANIVQAPNTATASGLPFEGLIGQNNPMAGTFSQVVGSVLAEQLPWYVFADPATAPVIEVVFLNGQQEPQVDMQEDFNSAGIKYRVQYPHGVGAIGWRGAVKNPGA